MKKLVIGMTMLILIAGAFSCCSTEQSTPEKKHTEEPSMKSGEHSGEGKEGMQSSTEGRGEHARDMSDSKEEGEESGTEFTKADTYDDTRNGARLILKYNSEHNVFLGTVENTTEKELERVRVEIHLSNGIELGPTTPTNLTPGQKIDVKIKASEAIFERWEAHPEVGNEEHGENGEERGEHSEKRGEHSKRERGEHSGERKGEHN